LSLTDVRSPSLPVNLVGIRLVESDGKLDMTTEQSIAYL